ncbi:MAG TPA: hypothetical protein VGD58_15470, partial [Herpetosiphonaceae bacterium]
MITLLADHNIEGQAALLWATLTTEDRIDLILMRLARFEDTGLARDSTDQEVWHLVQHQGMLSLTANRNMDGEDSLEQTIRRENTPQALPIITISKIDQMVEASYRIRCATRLAEIVLYLPDYLGTGRL